MTRRPPARRRRRVLLAVGAGLLLACGAAGIHLTQSALNARELLVRAEASAGAALAAVEARDIAAADAAVREMTDAAARAVPDDPVWRLAELVPLLGSDLAAVRRIADDLSRLGADVVQPVLALADEADGADAVRLVDLLRAHAQPLRDAEGALDAVAADAGSLAPGPVADTVAPQLGHAVQRLNEVVAVLDPVVSSAADAADTLPATLGADGPRTILVMVQNPAELRTGGGITGSFVQIDAAGGGLTLAGVSDSADFAPAPQPLVALHPGEERTFGDGIGRFVQNASMTSDFALTARLASAWWQSRGGPAPDTVVSIDPLVLASILEVVGPVETPAGAIASTDVVDALLVEPYLTLEPEAQAARFAGVAEAVFAALVAQTNPIPIAASLAGPIDAGRVSVWSRHADEQAVIDGTAVAGPEARRRSAGPDAFAVYFNDATGGKLTPYLDVGLAMQTATCREDGRAEVAVTVRVASELPPDAADTLPVSVTGGGLWGATAGFIAPTISVAAPPGWFVGGVELEGVAVPAVTATDGAGPVVTRRTDLPPGASNTLVFRFVAPRAEPVEPSLVHTPLLTDPVVETAAARCA